VTRTWWSDDDDQLLALLKDAITTEGSVPASFVQAGRAAYAWRTIDAELAELAYDSATAESATRAEAATLRALTFVSANLTIEIQLTPDALYVQITPAQAGTAVAQVAGDDGGTREAGSAEIDDLGFVVLRPVPPRPFRLLVRAGDAVVLTGLVTE
jgi:hypothetical protein